MSLKPKKCDIIVGVAGNPNVGKSTLFNVLTGETAHVANWPGVTVELKQGIIKFKDKTVCLVDLPGTYSISALSIEEVIAREFIVENKPDVVMVLVDSTAPERTLYLAVQILELTPNVLIVLTKADLAHPHGVHIHVDKLSSLLSSPIVSVSAIKNMGIRELLERIIEVAEGKRRKTPLRVDYGPLEPFIMEIEGIIKEYNVLKKYNPRWAAVRLLEGDGRLEELLKAESLEALAKVRELREAIRRSIGKDPSEVSIERRFKFVDLIIKECVVRVEKPIFFQTTLDKIFLHPTTGPIMAVLTIFITFLIAFTINIGFPLNIILKSVGLGFMAEAIETYSLSGLLEELLNLISEHLRATLTTINTPLWVTSLICDGIVVGVGAVLSFLPLIMMVYALLGALEDSGIAPRIAVAFDRFLRRFGLSGRAVFPVVVSLGCNVPGVLATRTMEDDAERVPAILSVPFIPCQARLIVLLAFATVFYRSPAIQSLVVSSVYAISLMVFLTTNLAARRLLYKKSEAPELLIEVPPLHKPSLKVIWWYTWDNSKHFLKKAGIIILSLSVITWLLLNLGSQGLTVNFEESLAAILGKSLAPLARIFEIPEETSWKVMFALEHGFVAKEAVLEAITLLSPQAQGIGEALRELGLNSIQAYSLLLLMTLYVPCLATVAVMYQETKRPLLTLFAIAYMLGIALFISVITYYLLKFIVGV